jgi:hypothetical protein
MRVIVCKILIQKDVGKITIEYRVIKRVNMACQRYDFALVEDETAGKNTGTAQGIRSMLLRTTAFCDIAEGLARQLRGLRGPSLAACSILGRLMALGPSQVQEDEHQKILLR